MTKSTFIIVSLVSLIAILCPASTAADIVWPVYSQQCQDDAGTPFGDDAEIYGPNGFYHDKSAAFPVLQNGECPAPLSGACQSRPTIKAAYLEGPIDCGDEGWYCRIMPDENWEPINLIGDLNFGHCNTTAGFEDAGYDRDGHCHGSSVDSTYYWWIRDHWFRQYNGRVRCCCGWYEGGTSEEPIYNSRIANRCDYRRLVTSTEDLSQCRDANEDHGLGFDDVGCDSKYESQLNKPIPENDSMCWEIQRFGYTEEEYETPTANPASAPTPTGPTPTAPTPTAPTPTAPTPTAPTPTAPTPTAPTPTAPTPTNEEPECEDSWLPFRIEIKGRNRWKTCEWAATRSTVYRCGLDEVVEQMCPDTCGTCDECVDSTGKFKFEFNDRRISRNCAWVAKRRNARCQIDGIELACRDTCGLCD